MQIEGVRTTPQHLKSSSRSPLLSEEGTNTFTSSGIKWVFYDYVVGRFHNFLSLICILHLKYTSSYFYNVPCPVIFLF